MGISYGPQPTLTQSDSGHWPCPRSCGISFEKSWHLVLIYIVFIQIDLTTKKISAKNPFDLHYKRWPQETYFRSIFFKFFSPKFIMSLPFIILLWVSTYNIEIRKISAQNKAKNNKNQFDYWTACSSVKNIKKSAWSSDLEKHWVSEWRQSGKGN